MKTILFVISCVLSIVPCMARISIVTTTEDLASLARSVGGDEVTVVSLARGDQDPHGIEPRPSMVMQVKKADLIVRIGMDLDMWVESLIDAARNKKVIQGGSGYLDVSEAVKKLEVPEGVIDGSMGDIHIYGNPHYWLNPENGKRAAALIAGRLSELSPDQASLFAANIARFTARLDSAATVWKQKMVPFAGRTIVTYHNSWPYFAEAFGLRIIGFIEPKPGIPPTPSHIAGLIVKMKAEKAGLIISEPYFNIQTARSVAEKAGAEALVLPPSVGGMKGADDYLSLFDHNINAVIKALERK